MPEGVTGSNGDDREMVWSDVSLSWQGGKWFVQAQEDPGKMVETISNDLDAGEVDRLRKWLAWPLARIVATHVRNPRPAIIISPLAQCQKHIQFNSLQSSVDA